MGKDVHESRRLRDAADPNPACRRPTGHAFGTAARGPWRAKDQKGTSTWWKIQTEIYTRAYLRQEISE